MAEATQEKQSNAVDVWSRSTEVADYFEQSIKRGDNHDLLLAQIPSLFGTSTMATYLGFRAIGLTTGQALEVLNLPHEQLEEWQENCPELIEFEHQYLYQLQAKVSADIVRLGFMRNMTMFLFKDQQVIRQGMVDSSKLTDRDFNYLRGIRRFYSTSDLLNLERAIAPEKHRDPKVILQFGGAMYEVDDDQVMEMRQVNEVQQIAQVSEIPEVPEEDNSE